MGDRGNVVVIDGGTDLTSKTAVFLYSHWSGSELPEILQSALQSDAGKKRATDAPYLARIIFDAMIGGDQGQETGFGIWTSITDNEHPLLIVDTRREIVVEYPESVYDQVGFAQLDTFVGKPFATYDGRWLGEDAEVEAL